MGANAAAPDAADTHTSARLAQLAERKALNLVVVGSSPTVGVCASSYRSRVVAPMPGQRGLGDVGRHRARRSGR